MKILDTAICEVKLLEPVLHRDERGFFSETFRKSILDSLTGGLGFVQDNHSFSKPRGVVRGLHFQTPPHAQGKLVRVIRGAIYDVAVDIRKGSPSFGQHIGVELSARNWRQLWVPPGFAHGFCTLEPDTEVLYKVTAYYAPEADRGLAWDDPALGINWPAGRQDALLSEKDRQHPRLADLPDWFDYEEACGPERVSGMRR